MHSILFDLSTALGIFGTIMDNAENVAANTAELELPSCFSRKDSNEANIAVGEGFMPASPRVSKTDSKIVISS
jgi:hypothetical protein